MSRHSLCQHSAKHGGCQPLSVSGGVGVGGGGLAAAVGKF